MVEGFPDPLLVENLMLIECPYSTKTWEVLGNPSSPPSRFPSTLKISLGLRPRDNSWVLGNLSAIGDGLSTGKDFLIHNCRKIDDERICLCSREIHPLLLYEISHVSGNLVRFLNISLVLVEHGYNLHIIYWLCNVRTLCIAQPASVPFTATFLH